jgi:nucleotide-binding universal stress UspA family protein
MYRYVVVPLDGSPVAEQALSVAAAIATKAGAELRLVRAWDPAPLRFQGEYVPPSLIFTEAECREAVRKYLDGVVERVPGTPPAVRADLIEGRVAESLAEYAAALDHALIVMTTHGHTGLSRAWLGSVADELVRTSLRPVLLWRPSQTPHPLGEHGFQHLLIPLDGSPASETVLPYAAELGRLFNARYTLLRVVHPAIVPVGAYPYPVPGDRVDPNATEDMVAHVATHLAEDAQRIRAVHVGATVETEVVVADRVAPRLLEVAQACEADLVCLTTHAGRAVRMVVGSVADKMLRATHGAMLVVRPPLD